MPRKYEAADFTTGEKPKIVKGSWRFSDRVYVFKCEGCASKGFGTTPKDAYNAWERNFRRRKAFYVGCEEDAARRLLILMPMRHTLKAV